jgi:hypothetical protein
MSEVDIDEIETAMITPISSDAYRDAMTVLKLIVDEKACARRLNQQRAATAAFEKAQAAYAAAKIEHDGMVERSTRMLETERAELAKAKVALHVAQAAFKDTRNQYSERYRQMADELDRLKGRRVETVGPGGGITREFFGHDEEPEKPAEDPPYNAAFSPPADATITRSSAPRRSSRREA